MVIHKVIFTYKQVFSTFAGPHSSRRAVNGASGLHFCDRGVTAASLDTQQKNCNPAHVNLTLCWCHPNPCLPSLVGVRDVGGRRYRGVNFGLWYPSTMGIIMSSVENNHPAGERSVTAYKTRYIPKRRCSGRVSRSLRPAGMVGELCWQKCSGYSPRVVCTQGNNGHLVVARNPWSLTSYVQRGVFKVVPSHEHPLVAVVQCLTDTTTSV